MARINVILKLSFVILFIAPSFVSASELVLKSGQKIEGKITGQTDKYIKIDTGIGVPVTYYSDQIDTVDGQKFRSSLLDFKLGTNNVDGNRVEFKCHPEMENTLVMEDADMLNPWKNLSAQKAKLVLDLYDKNKKLIYSYESGCSDSRGLFSPITSDITKEKVKDIAYFSVSPQNCSDPAIVNLGDSKPEEVFAKKVISAIKQGKSAFLVLYSSQPSSDAKIQEQEQARLSLLYFLNNGGQFTGFAPLKIQDAIKYKNICSQPLYLNIGIFDKTVHKDGGTDEGSLQAGLPIGKVNGEWKVLYAE